MSTGALEPEPIRPDEFHQSLSIEYDLTLVRQEQGLYLTPGMYCDGCGTLHGMLFANTEAGLQQAMSRGESMYAMLSEEATGDDPEVGVLICSECGSGHGCDLGEKSLRVLEFEDYKQYAGFRTERGEPL